MDWYGAIYYGSEMILSLATIVLLLRIAKAATNVTDIIDIYRQITSSYPGPPRQ